MPDDRDSFEVLGYAEFDLEFVFGDAPTRSWRLREETADGTYVPMNLSGKTLDLIAKTNPTDADTAKVYEILSSAGTPPQIVVDDDGSGVGDTYSKISVKWDRAALEATVPAGAKQATHHYRIRVKDGTRPETVIAGQIVVKRR